MSTVTPSVIAEVVTLLGRIDRFLQNELVTTISDGRNVLEPQRDWATVVDCCSTLRSFRFAFTEQQNLLVEQLIGRIQSNLNEIAAFLRQHIEQSKSSVSEATLVAELNELLNRTRNGFEESAFALRRSLTIETHSHVSVPIDILDSVSRLRADHPDATKTAFVMMQFGTTKAHSRIFATLQRIMKRHGLDALRADDKHYHDDLFQNIQTYMHVCNFGIAVFERIENDDFNPNVSLEVGYMIALGKPVLLLKDKTLPVLPTDLVGRLYSTFDPFDISKSLSDSVEKWLGDKSLIKE